MGARSSQTVAYHIDRASVRMEAPAIGPLHSEFYHGTRVADEQTGSFTIIKNVCATPSVSIVDQELILTKELMDSVRSIAECRAFAPVDIEHTYRYPFAPGDTSFLKDGAYSLNIKSYERIAMRFCKKYGCEFTYPHDLVAVDLPVTREGTRDGLQCQIPPLPEEGGFGGKFELSPDEVRTRGLVRVLGMVVSPAVWGIISDHLKFPYFIVHKIDQKGHAERVPLK